MITRPLVRTFFQKALPISQFPVQGSTVPHWLLDVPLSPFKVRRFPIGCWLFLAFACNCPAAAVTWLGNSNTNWNTAANWSGANVPAANDTLVFTNAGTAGANLHNDIPAGRVFNGITFAANATNAYTLSGNAFGLNGTLLNSGTNIPTINNAISLAANSTISPTSTNLVLAGAISDGGSNFGLTRMALR